MLPSAGRNVALLNPAGGVRERAGTVVAWR